MSTTGSEPKPDTPALETEQSALLSRKINELALRIRGTHLETLIAQLYRELDQAGITFKPETYLADEWGCPDDVPVIGIPFYLADPALCRLEGQLTGIAAESDAEVMMYLRHETGHALNYAYRLHTLPKWQQMFGLMSQPYQEEYRPVPFSTRYVRHVPGWYGQKHPDEDFAETFAVWLTPGSNWRERYADTPALAKLRYVDGLMRQYSQQPPRVHTGALDTPVEEMDMSLAEWYATPGSTYRDRCTLPTLLDQDLRTVFPDAEGEPAAELVRAQRGQLIQDLYGWTGVNRHLLGALCDELLERVQALGLKVAPQQSTVRLVSLAILMTTLVMNYHYTEHFVNP